MLCGAWRSRAVMGWGCTAGLDVLVLTLLGWRGDGAWPGGDNVVRWAWSGVKSACVPHFPLLEGLPQSLKNGWVVLVCREFARV